MTSTRKKRREVQKEASKNLRLMVKALTYSSIMSSFFPCSLMKQEVSIANYLKLLIITNDKYGGMTILLLLTCNSSVA